MNAIHKTNTKRFVAALGVAAAAAVAPALLFAGAGAAQAAPCSAYDDAASCSPFPSISDEELGSVTAAPGSMGGYAPQAEVPLWPQPQPVPGASAWANLPQTNSSITAIFDALGIQRGW
jgi:hypothetical protein